MTFTVPAEWGLTHQEAKLVAFLVDAQDLVCRNDLYAAVAVFASEPSNLKVVLHRVRRKLAPFNVAIINQHGRGVRIEAAVKDQLLAGAISIPEQERKAA